MQLSDEVVRRLRLSVWQQASVPGCKPHLFWEDIELTQGSGLHEEAPLYTC